jgi:hypothetical protein
MEENKTTVELQQEIHKLLQDAKDQAEYYDADEPPERALCYAVARLCDVARNLDERLRRLEEE